MGGVYLLWHSYELENGCEETKMLGVFSSEEKARDAIAFYRGLPGFRDRPKDFCIDWYELDVRHWTEGYISWAEASAENDADG
ncbi:MAG: hypothetical protein DBX91_08770 [Subdoligranulum variabile]|nr:MAG: hypothetical protein DBX91_08770 [Subdoligranulum variabile]